MKLINLKKVAATSALGLVALLGTSVATSAQYRGNDRNQNKRIIKQQQKAAKAEAKAYNARVRAEQLRQQQLNDRRPYTYNSNYHLNAGTNRYRVNRGGRYYNTDQRGADLLRQAVWPDPEYTNLLVSGGGTRRIVGYEKRAISPLFFYIFPDNSSEVFLSICHLYHRTYLL